MTFRQSFKNSAFVCVRCIAKEKGSLSNCKPGITHPFNYQVKILKLVYKSKWHKKLYKILEHQMDSLTTYDVT